MYSCKDRVTGVLFCADGERREGIGVGVLFRPHDGKHGRGEVSKLGWVSSSCRGCHCGFQNVM